MEIKVVSNILKANERIAEENRAIFQEKNLFVLNIMGSPGAGKTSLLFRTIERLKKDFKIGVIEGDIATSYDADLIRETGVGVVQINTRGTCHLDAKTIKERLMEFDLKILDILFIENVGNLVCPASFRLGEDVRVVISSVPEGDDKPSKYPPIFREADLIILNKIDLLGIFEFNLERFREDIFKIKGVNIIDLSCKTGVGLSSWFDWLIESLRYR